MASTWIAIKKLRLTGVRLLIDFSTFWNYILFMVEWWLYHFWIVGDLDLETIQKMENVRIEFIRIAIVKTKICDKWEHER